ncbi:MAG: DMT family transporter [Bacteroidetes bacterium]|nr:DMT family transporter [Candidatus Colenecus caballi]
MKNGGIFLYHFLAFMTMALWGVTFVSTKMLINAGLTPAQIFTIRFIIAYIGLWAICLVRGSRRLLSESWTHELIFLVLGITGGSMYFLTENTALANTQACNVSFIVCIAPLLTTILTLSIRKLLRNSFSEKLEDVRVGLPLIAGTVLALLGMGMVIFDGVGLNLSPKGDILAFLAALCWAVYSQFMGQMTDIYGTYFATRKVFFYGLLTIIPVLLMSDNSNLSAVRFSSPEVWGNLLFLAVMASLVCFVVWNRVMATIGNVTATNYVYLNPVFTLITAVIVLGESMTFASGLGSVMILGGVIIAGSRIPYNRHPKPKQI